MAWLVSGDRVLASLEIASTRRQRRKGLLGRDEIEGAMLLRPARSVHTVGMRVPIDVAYVDADLVVQEIVTMPRHRIGWPRWRSRAVIEARAGAFDAWGIAPGAELEIRQ